MCFQSIWPTPFFPNCFVGTSYLSVNQMLQFCFWAPPPKTRRALFNTCLKSYTWRGIDLHGCKLNLHRRLLKILGRSPPGAPTPILFFVKRSVGMNLLPWPWIPSASRIRAPLRLRAGLGAFVFLLILAPNLVREAHKHHANARPLLWREWVAVPKWRHKDAHELARRRDRRVRQRPELANGGEDEVLADRAAKTKEEDVPRSVRVRHTKLHGRVSTTAGDKKHEGRHIQGAPQVHPHHQMPRIHLRVPIAMTNHIASHPTNLRGECVVRCCD